MAHTYATSTRHTKSLSHAIRMVAGARGMWIFFVASAAVAVAQSIGAM